MGGMQTFATAVEALQTGYKKMNPFCIPFAISNMGERRLLDFLTNVQTQTCKHKRAWSTGAAAAVAASASSAAAAAAAAGCSCPPVRLLWCRALPVKPTPPHPSRWRHACPSDRTATSNRRDATCLFFRVPFCCRRRHAGDGHWIHGTQLPHLHRLRHRQLLHPQVGPRSRLPAFFRAGRRRLHPAGTCTLLRSARWREGDDPRQQQRRCQWQGDERCMGLLLLLLSPTRQARLVPPCAAPPTTSGAATLT